MNRGIVGTVLLFAQYLSADISSFSEFIINSKNLMFADILYVCILCMASMSTSKKIKICHFRAIRGIKMVVIVRKWHDFLVCFEKNDYLCSQRLRLMMLYADDTNMV